MGRVFISYRREETAYPAGWLYDRLANHYGGGQVFKDVDSIELGADFVQVITRAVGSCDVLLAMIGEQWLTVTDEHGQRRLDDPDDFVRLEIEAALTRGVRVIPILVNGATMPRAEELPHSLVPLRRRQALELSPSRFEYDTGRLLKVLDTTLAEVRTAHDDAAIPTPPAPQARKDTAESRAPAAVETVHGVPAEKGSTSPLPVARPLHEGTLGSSNTRSRDNGKPRDDVIPVKQRRTLRRLLMICIPLAAILVTYLLMRFGLDRPTPPQDSGAQSSATNGFKAEAPWRLVIRNDGSSTGCTITLVNNDTRETWSNPYAVHDTASFLITQGGTFRWSVEPSCTVVSRPGPGSLTLPAVVEGAGTSDAFQPPPVIRIRVRDFHGNQRCDLELRDVATGTVVDIGELNKQQDSVTLQPQGRPLVYLVNDLCTVQVSSN